MKAIKFALSLLLLFFAGVIPLAGCAFATEDNLPKDPPAPAKPAPTETVATCPYAQAGLEQPCTHPGMICQFALPMNAIVRCLCAPNGQQNCGYL